MLSTGGAIANFAISATPAGMSFNLTTGALTGTPTTVAGATAYTITATNASGSAVRTFTLTVTAGAVAITTASAGTSPGVAFTTQPQITIQDSGGNTVTSSSLVVTATVSSGGTLVGTKTATASSGIATFSNLGIRGFGGTAYTITYTASGLTAATQSVTPSALRLGDTGPGGGKIFYVAASPGFDCGPTLAETCYYLEAALTSGTNAWSDVYPTWSTLTNQSLSVVDTGTAIGTGYKNSLAIAAQISNVAASSAASYPSICVKATLTNQSLSVVDTGTAIGTGYKNSLAIAAQISNVAASSAAVAARDYAGPNNLSDWFLPSKDELNKLYIQRTIVGGFVDDGYWSSSEDVADGAWVQDFGTGSQNFDYKGLTFYVRPVRAF
ncbi:MAG: DUF1566 domain-containing protein [Actinobacteria bacterium]|nr:DUF1566 domain-containing protein [Actinomycetota bacterium]